jgi:GTP1/Obg family GTP-binding protein
LKYKKIEVDKAAQEAEKLKAAEEEKLKKAQEKEERKQINKKYRETVKDIVKYCEEKMPGSRYDRFYVDEMVKKY